MSGQADAIDFVLSLRTGESFTLRGRRFTREGGGVSHYEGRMTVAVWNERNNLTVITVRATDKVARA